MIDHIVGAIARFILAGLFGLLVSWVIVDATLGFALFGDPPLIIWTVAFVAVPIAWGLLGVFFYEKALDWALRIFEDWRRSGW